MKKIVVFLVALCAMCGSAFAEVTISGWSINGGYDNPVIYDGLITDIYPTGFGVAADPEMWNGDEENRPMASFISENIFPSWTIFSDVKAHVANTFKVKITGFDDLIIKDEGTPWPGCDMLNIGIFSQDPHTGIPKMMFYSTYLKGDGVYTFGYDQVGGAFDNFEAGFIRVSLYGWTETSGMVAYYLGDNTRGTIEFILPENEVPEPSSLLALAFGGAGTALAAYRRKQR